MKEHDIGWAAIDELKKDLQKLEPEQFLKKYNLGKGRSRNFVYGLHSDFIARPRSKIKERPVGMIGMFTIGWNENKRAIFDGCVYLGFQNPARKEFFSRWTSDKINDQIDLINFVFRVQNPNTASLGYSADDFHGQFALEASRDIKPVVGDLAFVGHFIDYTPVLRDAGGYVYAEELGPDMMISIGPRLEEYIEQFTGRARGLEASNRTLFR